MTDAGSLLGTITVADVASLIHDLRDVATAPDRTTVMQALARTLAPRFGDHLFVHLEGSDSLGELFSPDGTSAVIAEGGVLTAFSEVLLRGESAAASVDDPSVLAALLGPDDTAARVALIVPLTHRDRSLGVIALLRYAAAPRSAAVLALLEATASLLSSTLHQALSHERAVLTSEALLSATVTDVLPEADGYVLSAFLEAAHGHGLGGDWYDAVMSNDDTVMFAVGDVVGHDAGSASLMTQLRNAVRAYMVLDTSPGEVLDNAANFLAATDIPGMATLCVGRLDTITGRVVVARAGHPPPIVAGRKTSIAPIAPDPVLGSVRILRHREDTLTLGPSELLLVFTDGVIERRGQSLDDGLAALAKRAQTWSAEAAGDLARLLNQEIRAVAEDDACLLVIGRRSQHRRRLSVRLAADVEEIARVRHRCASWLRRRGVEAETIELVSLALSELCANGIEAAAPGTDIGVAVAFDDHRASVAVSNVGNRFNPPPPPSPTAPRGRGLMMLRNASDRLEIEHEDGTTSVSCVFIRP